MTESLRRAKNPHDIFINLDGSIEMAVRSKKLKAVTLVKWLAKRGVKRIQEEHQLAIENHLANVEDLTRRVEAI